MSLTSMIIGRNSLASRIKMAKLLDGSPLKSRSVLLQRAFSQRIQKHMSQLTPKEEESFDPDKPVVFSKSPASKSSKFTITNNIPASHVEQMPWYHPHATLVSFMIFIIYFLALREENDIDLAMGGSNVNDYAKEILTLQKKVEYEEKRRSSKTW